ncbi:MAG: hypothetical protein K2Q22_13180, partial [Cytophagales bacterium]|nr:hypothetical protein [Cytophagales bacterium]
QQFQLDPRLNGNPDTLRFVQLTQSANASVNYVLGKPENNQIRNNLALNLTYQTSGEKQGEGSPNVAQGTNFYNGSLSFSRSVVPTAFSATAGFSTNYSTIQNTSSLLLSPTLTLSKGFFNKAVKPSATLTWSSSYANGKKSSDIFNFRLGLGYTYRKKHTLSTNFTIVSRNPFSLNATDTPTKNNTSFTEYTWNLGYSFQF